MLGRQSLSSLPYLRLFLSLTLLLPSLLTLSFFLRHLLKKTLISLLDSSLIVKKQEEERKRRQMLEAADNSNVLNRGFSQLQNCFGDCSSEEELTVLPRHTKVVVTGNNRTKSVLVGLQGVVQKAVGLGGWHWLVRSIIINSPSKLLPFFLLGFYYTSLKLLQTFNNARKSMVVSPMLLNQNGSKEKQKNKIKK